MATKCKISVESVAKIEGYLSTLAAFFRNAPGSKYFKEHIAELEAFQEELRAVREAACIEEGRRKAGAEYAKEQRARKQ